MEAIRSAEAISTITVDMINNSSSSSTNKEVGMEVVGGTSGTKTRTQGKNRSSSSMARGTGDLAHVQDLTLVTKVAEGVVNAVNHKIFYSKM